MGNKDIIPLHKIYEKVKEYCKLYKYPFHFKVDDGDYETAIEFFFLGKSETWEVIHPPRSKSWGSNPTILCPDLLDFEHRLIIEYEEEGQKVLSGARLARRGHGPEGDILNKRDTRRKEYYDSAKFNVLLFYETDLKEKNWQKLHDFLQK